MVLNCIHKWACKLDGVGPVDNRPSTDKLHHFVQKKQKNMWHMTCDTWHMTHDTWHMTHDTWHVWGGGWTFSQNFSSLALTVCDLWYYEDLEEKDEWINYEAVYRTAPATLGLLKTSLVIFPIEDILALCFYLAFNNIFHIFGENKIIPFVMENNCIIVFIFIIWLFGDVRPRKALESCKKHASWKKLIPCHIIQKVMFMFPNDQNWPHQFYHIKKITQHDVVSFGLCWSN